METKDVNVYRRYASAVMCGRVEALIKPAHRWSLNFDPVVDNRFSLHLSRPLNEGEIAELTSTFHMNWPLLYSFKAHCIKTVLTVDYEVKNLG